MQNFRKMDITWNFCTAGLMCPVFIRVWLLTILKPIDLKHVENCFLSGLVFCPWLSLKPSTKDIYDYEDPHSTDYTVQVTPMGSSIDYVMPKGGGCRTQNYFLHSFNYGKIWQSTLILSYRQQRCNWHAVTSFEFEFSRLILHKLCNKI